VFLALAASCAQIVGIELDGHPRPGSNGGAGSSAGGADGMGDGGQARGGSHAEGAGEGGSVGDGGGAVENAGAGGGSVDPGGAGEGGGGASSSNDTGCEEGCTIGNVCIDRVKANAAAGTERACVPDSCANGKKDATEQLIDCGGDCGRCDQVASHAFRLPDPALTFAIYRRPAAQWIPGGFSKAGQPLSNQVGDVPVLGLFDQQPGLSYALFDHDGSNQAGPSWSAVKIVNGNPVVVQVPITLQVPAGEYVPLAAAFLPGPLHNFALWNVDTGDWYVFKLGDGTPQAQTKLGKRGDTPVPGNYDGVDPAEYAVFDAGTWTAQRGDSMLTLQRLGDEKSVPVPCFYDAGESFDLGVYDPETHHWQAIDATSGKKLLDIDFKPTDSTPALPLAGDFDGDGICDPTYWHPSTRFWETFASKTMVPLTKTFPGP
jgi:hypothetical protein